MHIQPTQAVSFAAIHSTHNFQQTPERVAVTEKLAQKFNAQMPCHLQKHSYLQEFENAGYDVFFSNGNDETSVRVDLSKPQDAIGKNEVFSDDTFVGEYNPDSKFNIREAEVVLYKQQGVLGKILQRDLIMSAAAIAGMVLLMLFGCGQAKANASLVKQNLTQICR